MIGWIKKFSAQERDTTFWFLALLGMLPALRADLLYPWSWIDNLSSQYALPACENLFGPFTLVLALAVGLLAAVSGKRWHYIAVIPHVTVIIADLMVGTAFQGFASVYAISTFALLLYFGFAGRALSVAFFSFLALLVLWQPWDGMLSWPQIVLFAAGASVLRLAVEAVGQNLPLAKQLGRASLGVLLWRTFSLWSPVIMLIVVGLWFSSQITSSAEAFLYESGFVHRYCAINPDDEESILLCPEFDQTTAAASDGRRLLYRDQLMCELEVEGQQRMCTLRHLKRPKSWQPSELSAYYCPTPGDFKPVRRAFTCPDLELESVPLHEISVFVSLDRTVEHQFNEHRVDLNAKLNTFASSALAKGDTIGGKAKEAFVVVPESTGMSEDSCSFLELKCDAANIVIGELNRAYVRARERARIQYEDYVDAKVAEGVNETTAMAEEIREPLFEHLGHFENRTRQSIDRVHSAANFVQKALLLWLVVIVIKSFLYVFARVIFDKSTNIDVDLLEDDGVDFKEGQVQQQQEVNVPGNYPRDLYYKANYQPLGPAPRFSIPQWRASLMSRIRYGAWNMSRVEMPLDDERGVTFNSIEGEHLIDWTLEDGEEVIFSYRNFVAIDENIELRTVISLRVATLLLGRIVFHTARCKAGTGRLLLRTRGKPATAAQVEQSIPMARLVAWNRYAKFSVDSHLTRADIFLNGFNLKRSAVPDTDEPQGILIVEADARDGGILVGTLRFARNFLLPV